jgi:hypothetical protein
MGLWLTETSGVSLFGVTATLHYGCHRVHIVQLSSGQHSATNLQCLAGKCCEALHV